MSDDGSIFDLGRNRALDEQVEHPGREKLRRLPKRFYKEASAAPREEGGFAVLLDGRTVKTPARAPLVVPSRALAGAMADEWAAQGEFVDPRTMWLTRLANTAIDRVSPRREAVIDEIAAFAGADLLCYRADHPDGLAQRQAEHWEPLLAWAEQAFGARLRVTAGIVHVAQDEAALAALRRAIADLDAFELSALHNAVTLTGSAILGLALVHGRLDPDRAFEAAHVDEAWQAGMCGEDEEEAARLALRRAELADTARFLDLLRDAA